MLHPIARLPEWPTEDRRSRFVFITKNIEKATVERMFRSFYRPFQRVPEYRSGSPRLPESEG